MNSHKNKRKWDNALPENVNVPAPFTTSVVETSFIKLLNSANRVRYFNSHIEDMSPSSNPVMVDQDMMETI